MPGVLSILSVLQKAVKGSDGGVGCRDKQYAAERQGAAATSSTPLTPIQFRPGGLLFLALRLPLPRPTSHQCLALSFLLQRLRSMAGR